MISREKLIEAAARVYAEVGFRGATTRRIADEAGVNEITIFRLFGSKAALIEEALRARTSRAVAHAALPDVPADPERELSAWAAAQLAQLRDERVLIRKTMAELEERPEMAPTLCGGWSESERQLAQYARRLRRAGRLMDAAEDGCGYKVDLDVAVSMLSATLFADAMGRDIMPEMYPQPPERAAVLYVRCFLRAIGCRKQGAAQDRTTRSTRNSRSAKPSLRSRTVTRTSP